VIRPAAIAPWLALALLASPVLAQTPEPRAESDGPSESSSDTPAPDADPPTGAPAVAPDTEPSGDAGADDQDSDDPDRERCERDVERQEKAEAEAAKKAAGAEDEAAKASSDKDRQAFEDVVTRYSEAAQDYQRESYAILKLSINEQRAWIDKLYSKQAGDLDDAERQRRMEAIARFKRFVKRYPTNEKYTPDAMFRLAELYYERAQVAFGDALDSHDEKRQLYSRGKIPEEPRSPTQDHTESIKVYRQLVARFGKTYRYADAVYYLLGYVLEENMDDEGARAAWTTLVERFPKSDYAAEVHLRIGETLFDFAEYKEAAESYNAVLNYPTSTYYDKALYKLAWSYFQDYDYDSAIKTFKRLISWYDSQNKTGATASALREEAIDYLALSLTEDDWDADGEKDPDAGVGRALGYLSGGTMWEREIIRAYGKGLYDLQDNKKWPEAITVYDHLLKSDPLDFAGPDYLKLVILIHDEMGAIDKAADARKRMVDLFGPKTAWWAKHATSPERREKLARAMEESLRQRALYHHERAQALKVRGISEQDESLLAESVDQYQKAATAYREYIGTYPDEPASYEMTFFYAEALWYAGQYVAAAPVYQAVATHAHHTTYREQAAWSMLKAYEKQLQSMGEAGELDSRFVPGSDWEPPEEDEEGEESADLKQVVAMPIPPQTQVWITAVDFFVGNDMKVSGSREPQSQIAYASAEMYYRANDFKEARKRFRQVIACYPGDLVAANAIANIINTYKAENDWDNLEKWADKAERLNLGDPNQQKEIRAAIKLFKLGSMFKRAEALYAGKKYLEAAREFERLATQNPDASFADKAFYNAADAYKREEYFDSAARIFERLVTDSRYKDSQFAEESLFELAEANKIFFNFEAAVSGYRALYDRYPEGKNRKYAFFQIAKLLQATGKLREAAQAYESYTDEYPDAKESAGAIYLAGSLYERIEDAKQQRRIWKLFISRHSETVGMESLIVEALGKLSDLALARKDTRGHKKLRQQILDEYTARGLKPRTPAAYVAAKARFQIVEESLVVYNKLRVKSSDLKKASATIEQKKTMLKDLQSQYGDLADYQSFEWVVAAVYRIADLYAEFAKMIYKVPEPKGLDDEELDMYITQIEDLGLQFENIAIQRYEQAVGESRKHKVTNEWARRALVAINKFKPDDYPLFKEEKFKTVFEPTYTLDTRAPKVR